jgi:hypothetical protein
VEYSRYPPEGDGELCFPGVHDLAKEDRRVWRDESVLSAHQTSGRLWCSCITNIL